MEPAPALGADGKATPSAMLGVGQAPPEDPAPAGKKAAGAEDEKPAPFDDDEAAEKEARAEEVKPVPYDDDDAAGKKAGAEEEKAVQFDDAAGNKARAEEEKPVATYEQPTGKKTTAVEKPAEQPTEKKASVVAKPAATYEQATGKKASVVAKPAATYEQPTEKKASAVEKRAPYSYAAMHEHEHAARKASTEKATSAGEKAKPFEDTAAKEEEAIAEKNKPAADKGDGRVDIPDDMVLSIAARLPSKPGVRSLVLSKIYRDRLYEPFFVKSHLAPRSRFFLGEAAVPTLVVLQPAAAVGVRQGYNHLTIVKLRGHVIYDMPVRAALEDGGAGDHYYDYSVTNYDVDGAPRQVSEPPAFFHKTVPQLDLALLAAEGRLLLAHSPLHGLFVCNATEDRIVRLPTPPVHVDGRRTAAAIGYKIGCWGEIDDLDVLLLSPRPSGERVLQRFSTTDGAGGWLLKDDINDDASVVAVLAGVSSPGIYASETGAYYWIDEHTGSLIRYVADEQLVTVVPPPPEIDGYPDRLGWSLGSTGGLPRVSCFNLPAETHGLAVHNNMNGMGSVWTIKDQTGWVLVKEFSVPVAWVYQLYRGPELPIDVTRADDKLLIVKKDAVVLWRDLATDELEFVSNLYLRDDTRLNRKYERVKAFSV